MAPKAALVLVLAAACSRPAALRSPELGFGSGADVQAILEANGVAAAVSGCANVRTQGAAVRAVCCRLRLSPSDVSALAAAVPLAPGPVQHPVEHYSDSCEATAGLGSKEPGVEVLVGKNTKVPNGASRIELHVVRATGAACVEIVYPWSS